MACVIVGNEDECKRLLPIRAGERCRLIRECEGCGIAMSNPWNAP